MNAQLQSQQPERRIYIPSPGYMLVSDKATAGFPSRPYLPISFEQRIDSILAQLSKSRDRSSRWMSGLESRGEKKKVLIVDEGSVFWGRVLIDLISTNPTQY